MSNSTGFLGADTAALRQLGQSMTSLSGEIDRVTATTSTALEQLSWTGQDRTGFWGDWSAQFAPGLRAVATALQGAQTDVSAQADDQERASDGGTGGGAVTAGGVVAGGVAGAVAGGVAGATLGAAAGASGTAGLAPQTDERLGTLSARYESRGDVGTVSSGKKDPGGISYGTYQFSSTKGTAAEFVNSLRTSNPAYYEALSGSKPASPEFATAWRGLAESDPEGFGQAQYDFAKASHYDPQYAVVERALPGINLAERSPVVRDVLWSTAVQHRGYTADIWSDAVGRRDVTTMSDADLIRAVYGERGRDEGAARFPSSPVSTQRSVANRFRNEERDALAMLGQ